MKHPAEKQRRKQTSNRCCRTIIGLEQPLRSHLEMTPQATSVGTPSRGQKERVPRVRRGDGGVIRPIWSQPRALRISQISHKASSIYCLPPAPRRRSRRRRAGGIRISFRRLEVIRGVGTPEKMLAMREGRLLQAIRRLPERIAQASLHLVQRVKSTKLSRRSRRNLQSAVPQDGVEDQVSLRNDCGVPQVPSARTHQVRQSASLLAAWATKLSASQANSR